MAPTTLRLLHAPAKAASLPDGEVVRRVVGGELVLFEVLMRRCNRRLYPTVRAVLRDEREVEDAMQQAYLRAFERLGQVRGEASFSTWLTRIGLHEALRRIRRARPLSAVPAPQDDGETQLEEPGPDPERAAGAREMVSLLERAVDRLTAPHRSALLLVDVEGLSSREAAEALEISEEALRARLHRGRRLLRRRLLAMAGEEARSVFPFEAPRCDALVGRVLARLAGGAGLAG